MPLITSFGAGVSGLGFSGGAPPVEIGGYSSYSEYGQYIAVKFTASGTMTVSGEVSGDALLVGGGQGGGLDKQHSYCLKDCGTVNVGGTGGSGGKVSVHALNFAAGNYSVNIGAGGVGANVFYQTGSLGGTTNINGPGLNVSSLDHGYSKGSNVFTTLIAGYYGGCGGGAGGGGNGGSGVSNPSAWGNIDAIAGGSGGPGFSNNYWNGVSTGYAGGGGGSVNENNSNYNSQNVTQGSGSAGGGTGARGTHSASVQFGANTSGAANTGGGGGGGTATATGQVQYPGRPGGSGVVIIRFNASEVVLV